MAAFKKGFMNKKDAPKETPRELLIVDYDVEGSAAPSMVMRVGVPRAWLGRGGCPRLLESFCASYAKKHGPGFLDPSLLHLEDENGSIVDNLDMVLLLMDVPVVRVRHSGAPPVLEGPPTAAAVRAKAAAAASAAAASNGAGAAIGSDADGRGEDADHAGVPPEGEDERALRWQVAAAAQEAMMQDLVAVAKEQSGLGEEDVVAIIRDQQHKQSRAHLPVTERLNAL